MDFKISQGQSFDATANFTDARGTPRPLPPGVIPTWACDPESACTLAPSADGLHCKGTGADADGDFKLTCTAECDPTPGVNTVTLEIDGHIVDPEDTTGTISVTVEAPPATPAS
jgi:hypothetical protein